MRRPNEKQHSWLSNHWRNNCRRGFCLLGHEQARWFACTKINRKGTERAWAKKGRDKKGKRGNLSEERKGISLERARELTTTHGECMQRGNPEGEQFYLFHQEHIPSLAPSISNSILGSPSQATAILPLACLLIYTWRIRIRAIVPFPGIIYVHSWNEMPRAIVRIVFYINSVYAGTF